ncbi:peptidyl-prolyl cis-trans isomerase SurA [Epilithonimonas hungarica]|uniref:peptidylprolyl isomerase n=1 Tax=Epilithonimonas hungarica TaxID=454006 RepID=UPI00277E9B61|nr:peptidylprolyl isomerase [Epilithonimonas hungarica]MDP9955297.1 peptidyl-prolyl cis-trans isomerase SurA [Epilithonimonas hungarica]
MKKIFFPVVLASQMAFSQYLIVGNDSISVKDYMRENKYGLENSGPDKSVNSTVEFLLLQQLAKEKKADTLNFFVNTVNQKLSELREQKFYPKNLIDPLLQDFVRSSNNEIQVLLFIKEKKADDKTDYKALYNEVKGGKMKMEDFLAKNANPEAGKAFYVKPGMLDYELYQQVKNTPVNSYTTFIDQPNVVAFAKVVNTRPSLGYMIFGVLTIPNDANYETTKAKIYKELESGKKFQEVVKEFGATEDEKKSGGAVMGSPILPDDVYNALKGQKKDYYTKVPILFNDKYFIFNIYNLEPYVLTDANRSFFQKEMLSTSYGEEMTEKLTDWLKTQNKYTETANLAEIKKSYQNYLNPKDPKEVLFTYGKNKVTYEDLKKAIDSQYKNLEQMPSNQWSDLVSYQAMQYVLGNYARSFEDLPEIKPELDELKKNLYSEYIFSEYLKNEVKNNPQLYTQYYNENKSKFVWEKRAVSRVAVVSDPKLVKDVEKELKDPKKWEALKTKYKDLVNDKNQVLVHFEEGKVQESADIFKKHNVPFKKGTFLTKIGERDVIVTIDELLPEQQMTQAEAEPEMDDAVTEKLLQKTIADQRKKTKIEIQPAFMQELNKNFKK